MDGATSDDAELTRALELSIETHDQTDELAKAIALSLAPDETCADETADILNRVLVDDAPSAAVQRQWTSQPIRFTEAASASAAAEATPGAAPFSAGLEQRQGGPCAVLAAAESFLLRRLLFDPDLERPQPPPEGERGWIATEASAPASQLLAGAALANAALLSGLADILWQAASAAPLSDGALPVAVVALPSAEWLSTQPDELSLEATVLQIAQARKCVRSWTETRAALACGAACLASRVGALAFLASTLLSRGLERVANDRGFESSTPLIDSQLGHCSQDALTLMLTGVCTSNVFDGNRDLGGGMVLRGIVERPPIGLLSEFEALRYMQVGSLYKRPMAPIWVVASQSHYTVLFGLSTRVLLDSAVTSDEEELFRRFSDYDTEDAGFISAERLPALLSALPGWGALDTTLLQKELDPEGTSLIVWDAFLKSMLPRGPSKGVATSEPLAKSAKAEPLVLYHYNGLAAAGHEHKGALRVVSVERGENRGVSNEQAGLAAVLQTRWKDARVTWEGVAPSIN